jgi:hypothetical protein
MRRSWLAGLVLLATVAVSCQTLTVLADGRVLLVSGGVAALYDPVSGSLTPTGVPTAPRIAFTATLLADGRVLFVGGSGLAGSTGSSVLASAELYDPGAGSFAPTGNLNEGRGMHSATLLLDGRVLVAGGGEISTSGDSPPPLVSAELYDATSGTFTPTGPLQSARTLHTATLLADGRVLITGGSAAEVILGTAELYDPASGSFSTTGAPSTARALQTATLLTDGHVLVVGGIATSIQVGAGSSSSGGPLATAELYDPASGTFAPTGELAAGHAGHTATLLLDGRVLVAGGLDSTGTGTYVATAELYDPATGTFTPTGAMTTARGLATASLLHDGRVLIAGGDVSLGSSQPGPTTWSADLYDPATGTFASVSLGGLPAAP